MSDTVLWLQSYSSQLRVLPVLLMLTLLACLIGLARWKQVSPYGPLAIILLGPCLLSLALVLYPQAFLLVATVDVVILLVAAADLFSLPKQPSFSVERSTLRIVSLEEAASGFADDLQPQRPGLAGLDPRRRAAGV